MGKLRNLVNAVVDLLIPEKSLSLFDGEPIPFQTQPTQKAQPFYGQTNMTAIIDLGGSNRLQTVLERKIDVKLLRDFSKSIWVRAAIDYYRRTAGRAQFEIVPVDTTSDLNRRDKRAKAAIEAVLSHPNEANSSYAEMKEKALEDYLVVGHGALYLDLNRDLTVAGVQVLDAGRIGFVKGWDGSDNRVPRYCEFDEKVPTKIKRYLAHQQVMCLVNRTNSYSNLGMSHVEILYKTVVALLSGDEYLINQILNPIANSMIDLGENATAQTVEKFKFEINQVNEAIAVIGGSKNTKVHKLNATPDEMRILDGATWFVRQVAAVFGISTAKLKLAVDTSRANTETMFDDDLEAVTGELARLEELENATFIKPFTYDGDLNLKFSYPIMHRKDEKTQSQIAKQQTGNNFTSINEARSRTGEKTYDRSEHPFADEILIAHPKLGPIPFTVFTKYIQQMEKRIDDGSIFAISDGGTGNSPDKNDPPSEPDKPPKTDQKQ